MPQDGARFGAPSRTRQTLVIIDKELFGSNGTTSRLQSLLTSPGVPELLATAPHPRPARAQGGRQPRTIRPPGIARGAPVVPGKLNGNPATTRAARNPKHCASTASPSHPTASTVSTGTPSRSRSAAMIVGLCRPPPVTSHRPTGPGNPPAATEAAVNATNVAAPSAADSRSTPLAANARPKSSRSSDFGAGRLKYGCAINRPSTASSTRPCADNAPSASIAMFECAAAQSSSGPFPGPVSNASNPPCAPIHVTLPTPPIFNTASGFSKSRANA